MTGGRIPLAFGEAAAAAGGERRRTALVLTRSAADGSGFALLRHADAAARGQAGACACCRVPADVVVVLRRLAIERAKGSAVFDAVLVDGEAAALGHMSADALADPFIAARYVVSGRNGGAR